MFLLRFVCARLSVCIMQIVVSEGGEIALGWGVLGTLKLVTDDVLTSCNACMCVF